MRHAYLDFYSSLSSPIHRLDARAKIVAFAAVPVICVSTPPQAYAAFAGYFLLLLCVFIFSRLPVKHVLTRSLAIVPFVLMVAVFIPFFKHDAAGGGHNLGFASLSISRTGILILWNVVVKSFIGILSLILLSSTTSFPDLLKGFESLRMPKVFTTLIAFMYRYTFVLVDEILRVKTARECRNGGGRWLWHIRSAGNIIATLFLHSYERAERVYGAMLSRGFDGQIRTMNTAHFTASDAVFVTILITSLFLIRLTAI
ncbi:MAG: cobalt ECF transporter T component CbiQ [bacterium]